MYQQSLNFLRAMSSHGATVTGPTRLEFMLNTSRSGYLCRRLKLNYIGGATASDRPEERQPKLLSKHQGYLLGIYHYPESLCQKDGERPLLIIAPGLGGDEHSPYARWAAQEALRLGFDTLLVSPRGSGGSSPGFYHGGWYQDLISATQHPHLTRYTRRYLVGFSMGGHKACRVACAPEGQGIFKSIFACCPPLDLKSTSRHIDQDSWRIYRRYLVEGIKVIPRRLLIETNAEASPLPTHVQEGLIRSLSVNTLEMFDHNAISALLGYESAEEYYAYESAVRYLSQVHTHLRCALNRFDPFIPALQQDTLAKAHCIDQPLFSIQTYPRGGHIYGGDHRERDNALGALYHWMHECLGISQA